MLRLITGLGTKLQFYLAMAGATIVAIAVVYLKGRREGAASAKEAVQQRTDKVREKWREIDSKPATLDDALDRLRHD